MASYNRIKATQQAPIGTIMPWSGASGKNASDGVPPGWIVLSSGQKGLNAADYPLLASVVGNVWSNRYNSCCCWKGCCSVDERFFDVKNARIKSFHLFSASMTRRTMDRARFAQFVIENKRNRCGIQQLVRLALCADLVLV